MNDEGTGLSSHRSKSDGGGVYERHTPRITKRSIKGFKACKGASDARLWFDHSIGVTHHPVLCRGGLTREPEQLFAFRHRRMGQMQGQSPEETGLSAIADRWALATAEGVYETYAENHQTKHKRF